MEERLEEVIKIIDEELKLAKILNPMLALEMGQIKAIITRRLEKEKLIKMKEKYNEKTIIKN